MKIPRAVLLLLELNSSPRLPASLACGCGRSAMHNPIGECSVFRDRIDRLHQRRRRNVDETGVGMVLLFWSITAESVSRSHVPTAFGLVKCCIWARSEPSMRNSATQGEWRR
jgi:hypothetical protein